MPQPAISSVWNSRCLPCPALPRPALLYHVLPCSTSSCPALPCSTSSCPALPCPALPRLALPLPCPAKPHTKLVDLLQFESIKECSWACLPWQVGVVQHKDGSCSMCFNSSAAPTKVSLPALFEHILSSLLLKLLGKTANTDRVKDVCTRYFAQDPMVQRWHVCIYCNNASCVLRPLQFATSSKSHV